MRGYRRYVGYRALDRKPHLGLAVAGLVAISGCGHRASTTTVGAPIKSAPVQEKDTARRAPRAESCSRRVDVGKLFSDHQVRGVFVLLRAHDGCLASSNDELAKTPFRPQSTFKIPNALIGLETGLISGPEHVWQWDQQPQRNPQWEQDLNLRQALRVSCVPCFRRLAREIGATKMRKYLQELQYGNQDISGAIDLFWLTGNLRITPVEQAQFVHKSLRGELPFKQEHVDLVWKDLELPDQGQLQVFGKTGLGEQDGLAIGWVVGFIQKGEKRWSFATLVQSLEGEEPSVGMPRLMPIRLQVTRAILDILHL